MLAFVSCDKVAIIKQNKFKTVNARALNNADACIKVRLLLSVCTHESYDLCVTKSHFMQSCCHRDPLLPVSQTPHLTRATTDI